MAKPQNEAIRARQQLKEAAQLVYGCAVNYLEALASDEGLTEGEHWLYLEVAFGEIKRVRGKFVEIELRGLQDA